MKEPNVNVGDIIKIGSGLLAPKAEVLRIYNEEERKSGVCGDIEVIYNQNNLKAVKDDLVWDDEEWAFKTDGPSGIAYDLDKYPKLK